MAVTPAIMASPDHVVQTNCVENIDPMGVQISGQLSDVYDWFEMSNVPRPFDETTATRHSNPKIIGRKTTRHWAICAPSDLSSD
jgi:hypothetical protein